MKILQREEQKQGMLLMAKIRRQWDAQEQRFEQELQVCPETSWSNSPYVLTHGQAHYDRRWQRPLYYVVRYLVFLRTAMGKTPGLTFLS